VLTKTDFCAKILTVKRLGGDNMLNKLKIKIKQELELLLNARFQVDIQIIVEEPKKAELGDLSIPVFSIVKELKQPLPVVIEMVKADLGAIASSE